MDIVEALLEAVNQLFEIIIALAIFFLCFIFPLIITVKNIIHLVKKDVPEKKKQRCTVITMVTGILLSAFDIGCISSYPWDVPVVLNEPNNLTELHEPFSSDYTLTLFLFALAAAVCLVILDRGKILPPLAAVLCVSGVYGGIILSLFYVSQLSVNLLNNDIIFIAIPYLLLFPLTTSSYPHGSYGKQYFSTPPIFVKTTWSQKTTLTDTSEKSSKSPQAGYGSPYLA